MIYVFIGVAVLIYGVYLFKKIKASKQDKNKNIDNSAQVNSEKVEEIKK